MSSIIRHASYRQHETNLLWGPLISLENRTNLCNLTASCRLALSRSCRAWNPDWDRHDSWSINCSGEAALVNCRSCAQIGFARIKHLFAYWHSISRLIASDPNCVWRTTTGSLPERCWCRKSLKRHSYIMYDTCTMESMEFLVNALWLNFDIKLIETQNLRNLKPNNVHVDAGSKKISRPGFLDGIKASVRWPLAATERCYIVFSTLSVLLTF